METERLRDDKVLKEASELKKNEMKTTKVEEERQHQTALWM